MFEEFNTIEECLDNIWVHVIKCDLPDCLVCPKLREDMQTIRDYISVLESFVRRDNANYS